MPTATFQEMLEIQVDLNKFGDQMRQVEKIYGDSLKRMPNLEEVNASQFTASIKKLDTMLENFKETGKVVFDSLSQQITDYQAKIDNALEKSNQKIAAAQEKLRQAQSNGGSGSVLPTKDIKEAEGAWGAFSAALFNDIPGLIAGVIRFSLIWKAVGEAINLTLAVITAPFTAVKEGFNYLQSFEERSSQLRASLLQSVQYSTDWGKNVAIASQEADRLTKRIDDLAIKMRTDSKIIQTGFETFLAFGGRNLVQNQDQALDLSALVTTALKTQNPNLSTRKIASEMQDLVSGTVKQSSKLAASLGVSRDTLNDMSIHARTTHDLFEQIVARSQGLQTYLDSAGQTQGALNKALQLYVARWEGLLAGPLFDRWKSILQSVLKYLDDHKDRFDQIAVAAGKVADALGEALESLAKASWKDFAEGMKIALELAVRMAHSIGAIVGDMTLLYKLWNSVTKENDADQKVKALNAEGYNRNTLAQTGVLNRDANGNEVSDAQRKLIAAQGPMSDEEYKKRYDKIMANRDTEQDSTNRAAAAFSEWAAQRDSIDKAEKDALDAIYGQKTSPTAPTPPPPAGKPNHGITAGRDDATKDMEQLKRDMQADMNELDEMEAAIRNRWAEREKAQTVDTATAEQKRIDSYKREHDTKLAMIDDLDKQYQSKKSTMTKDEQKNFEDQMRNLRSAANKQFNSGTSEAQGKSDQEQLAIGNVKEDTARKLAQQQRQQLIAMDNAMVQAGLKTKEDAIAHELQLENEAYISEMNAIKAKESATENLLAKEKLHQQAVLLTQQHLNTLMTLEAKEQQAQEEARRAEAAHQNAVSSNRLGELQNTAQAGQIHGQTVGQAQGNAVAVAQQEYYIALQKQKQALLALQDAYLQTTPPTKEKLNELKDGADAAAVAVGHTKNNLDAVNNQMNGTKKLFGFDTVGEAFKNVGNSAQSLASAFGNAMSFVNKIQAGIASGGTAGGVGAGLSSAGGLLQQINGNATGLFGKIFSGLGSLGSAVPVVGQVFSAVGSIVGMLGGLFTAAARRIGEEIKKNISTIMEKYQLGQITLNQTLTQLEQQRVDAINRLSGKKGGKDQLNQILPQLDQQIHQLEQQQQQIQQSFDDALSSLRAHGTVLADWLKQWEDINKQVKDYLGATTDADKYAKANEFLNLSLAQQRQSLQDKVNDGEQKAIQDAIQLNDLLQQRISLQQQEAKTEFGILTADSLERRISQAVLTGQQLFEQRTQYQKQLDDLNQQIDLQQKQVDMQKSVFDIATDIAALHRRDEALTLAALQQQLTEYSNMLDLLNKTQGLSFSGSNISDKFIPGVSVAPTINVVVNSNDDPQTIGRHIGKGIKDYINDMYQGGYTTYPS